MQYNEDELYLEFRKWGGEKCRQSTEMKPMIHGSPPTCSTASLVHECHFELSPRSKLLIYIPLPMIAWRGDCAIFVSTFNLTSINTIISIKCDVT